MDKYKSQSQLIYQSSSGGFQASQMPIKNRVGSIDNQVREFTKYLNENKKEAQILRSECATLEHQLNEGTNDILKEILGDIANLERDFRKMQQMDINEMNNLKQQQNHLQMEKQRIQQNVVLLDSRVSNLESDVGFE